MATISGLPWHIEEEIGKLLKSRIPEGCTLDFEESEESESVGLLMDDHDEYSGRLVITLVGVQTRTLTSLKSTNTFRESVSGGNSLDRNQYHYSIKKATVSRWFQNDPAN